MINLQAFSGEKMKISFIGLGKLGLPLACCLAASGRKILCVDKNEHVLDTLKRGQLPFFEPGLEDLLKKADKNLIGFTDSYSKAIEETDVSLILVNTQLGDDGYASDFVEAALSDIAINLRDSDKPYHTIVLSSTVLPGTIKDKLIPLVENISNRKYKEGFGFSYVPDFVRLGMVIEDFKNPEFFLIGSNCKKDYKITKKIFKDLHENKPPHYSLTLEEVEVAKVALNAFIVNKITFANFLGQLCDELENVNVHNITETIGNDKRISPFFFSSGAPYGGTCFPRDTWAFIRFAKDRGKEAKNLIFAEEVNEMVYQDIFKKVSKYKKVGILGVSFKPNSPVTIGSPSARLIKELKRDGKEVYTYDPIPEVYSNLRLDVNECSSIEDCLEKSEVVAIMHYDERYKKVSDSSSKIIDVWGNGRK